MLGYRPPREKTPTALTKIDIRAYLRILAPSPPKQSPGKRRSKPPRKGRPLFCLDCGRKGQQRQDLRVPGMRGPRTRSRRFYPPAVSEERRPELNTVRHIRLLAIPGPSVQRPAMNDTPNPAPGPTVEEMLIAIFRLLVVIAIAAVIAAALLIMAAYGTP